MFFVAKNEYVEPAEEKMTGRLPLFYYFFLFYFLSDYCILVFLVPWLKKEFAFKKHWLNNMYVKSKIK